MIFARHLQRNQLLLEYVDCMCVCLSPPTFSLDLALFFHSQRCWDKCDPPCQSPVEALAYIRSHLGKLMSLPPSKCKFCKFYKQGSNGVRALFKMLNLLINVMHWGHSRVAAKRRKIMGKFDDGIWQWMRFFGNTIFTFYSAFLFISLRHIKVQGRMYCNDHNTHCISSNSVYTI